MKADGVPITDLELRVLNRLVMREVPWSRHDGSKRRTGVSGALGRLRRKGLIVWRMDGEKGRDPAQPSFYQPTPLGLEVAALRGCRR